MLRDLLIASVAFVICSFLTSANAQTVEFAADADQGGETTTPVTIPVTLTPAAGVTVTVDYAVTGGTAVPDAGRSGGDFSLAAGQLEFLPGDTQKLIELNVSDDAQIEDAETVVITLSSPSNAALGTTTEFTYTITDEDTDADGLSDDWEWIYFDGLDEDAAGDPDEDLQTNAQEAAAGTDPTGKEWELMIAITESHVLGVSLGISHFATRGLDPGRDALSPPSPPDSRYAAFLNFPGLPDLVTDLRGDHANDRWTLRVTAATGDSSRATSVLTWDTADVPDDGLRLLEVDGAGDPVVGGVDIDMAQVGEVAVASGDTVYFEIQFGDFTPPAVEITTSETSPTKAVPIPVTIAFSRPVDGLDLTEIVVGNGAPGNLQGDHELYTVDITPTADGDVTVDIAQDVAEDHLEIGNAAAAQFTIVSDTTPPDAPDVTGITDDTAETDGTTSDPMLVFGGTAEADATVEVFVESVSVGTTVADGVGDWSFDHTQTELADGVYAVTATATDAAENTSQLSTEFTVTVDTIAPDVPGTPDLTEASDSGSSNADNITNVATPTLEGTSEPGTTIALASDADGPLGATTADGAGDWTITVPELSDGDHVVTATATDTAGNQSDPSAGLTITIDTDVPTTPSAPNLNTASDSGMADDDNVTNNATPTFSGVADADLTIALSSSVDGILGATLADGTWSIVSTTMADGVHAVTAIATDVAGNTSSISGSLDVTIDTDTPAIPSTPDLSVGSDSGTSSTDDITNDNTPDFEGTADAGIKVVLESDLDGVLGTADSDGTWTVTASVMSENTHQVSATAVDLAGNESEAAASLTVLIDTAAPAVPSAPDLTTGSDYGASETDDVTNDNTPDFVGTADADASVSLTSDVGGALGTADSNGDWAVTALVMADGIHVVSATASDVAGNTSVASEALTVTIDTAAPAVPSVPDMDAASDSGESDSDNTTNVTTPIFGGTADDGSTVALFSSVHEDVGTVASNGAWGITTSALDEGTHEMSATAEDLAGNISDESGSVTVVIDATPPDAPSTPDLNAGSDTGSSDTDNVTSDDTPVFDGASEPDAAVELMIDGENLGNVVADGAGTWSFAHAGTELTDGAYGITAIAMDLAGNTGPESTPLAIVVDTAPATVSVTTTATEPATVNPIPFTLTFSEPITGLEIGDLIATNGIPAALSGTTEGLIFDVNVTPTEEGLVTLAVPEGAAEDAAGNPTGGEAASVTYEADLNEPWTAFLNVTGAQAEDIAFGMAPNATDGNDDGIDLLAESAEPDGGYVAFANDGLADLENDMRPQADMATWRLQLTAPTGRADAVLSWDPAQFPVVGLSLVETDEQWEPLPNGTNIDMNRATSPEMVVAGGSTRYFTILYRHAIFVLAIHNGWNLLSVPIQPFETSAEALLGDVAVGPAWTWDASGGYYESLATVDVMEGFWLYHVADGQRSQTFVTVRGQIVATPIQSISAGWNLIAPVAPPPYEPIPLPLVVEPVGALSETLWNWNGTDYDEPVGLLPGLSYWGVAAEDAAVGVGGE
ncbi:MAG: hypothetical protein HN742_34240 [Lentisphaerae bacterium]|jgi:hypothetical protein|nr:hypothetical protein [Lentisphaerota bacterium]MBT4818833.1 hypothetical protein [Lentisphaerota bacterium]MBT5612896.1 hypothetical protein [Lentisphaerota bacterium]MBT7060958.1 hypothetical protein [Lentisphaerota bacterium]MBT7846983.1 hypothetical protein [Lentisphaerota bacterium]